MNLHQFMGAVSSEAHQPVGTQVPEAMPRRLAHPYPADAAPPALTSLATPAPQPSPVPTPLPVTVGPRILLYGQHLPVREPGVRAVFMPRVVLNGGRMNMTNAGYTGDGKTKDAAMVKVADESSASLCAVQDRSSCCGTLQLPEFQVVDRARPARRGSLYDDDILAAELAELGRVFSKGV